MFFKSISTLSPLKLKVLKLPYIEEESIPQEIENFVFPTLSLNLFIQTSTVKFLTCFEKFFPIAFEEEMKFVSHSLNLKEKKTQDCSKTPSLVLYQPQQFLDLYQPDLIVLVIFFFFFSQIILSNNYLINIVHLFA